MSIKLNCMILTAFIVLVAPLTISSDLDASESNEIHVTAQENGISPQDADEATASFKNTYNKGMTAGSLIIDAEENFTVDVPGTLINAATECNAPVTINLETGSLTFTVRPPESLGMDTSGCYTFGIETINAPEEHESFVGEDNVINLNIQQYGEQLTPNFGEYVQVTIPYKLPSDRSPEEIMVFGLPDEGIPAQMSNVRYTIEDGQGYLTFTADRGTCYSFGTGDYLPTYEGPELDLLSIALFGLIIFCGTFAVLKIVDRRRF